jgi:hypothetical protein
VTNESQLREFTLFLQRHHELVLEAKLPTIREPYRFMRLRTESGNQLTLDSIKLDSVTLDKYNTLSKLSAKR